MNELELHKRKIVFPLVGLSLGLGLLANYLFVEQTIGLSFPVFFALFAAVAVWLSKYIRGKRPADVWLLAPMAFFACVPAMTDSPFLVLLNVAAVLGLLVLLLRSASGGQTKTMDFLDHALYLLSFPFNFIRTLFGIIRSFVGKVSGDEESPMLRVIIGLVAALPVLLIFTALFSSADLAFGRFVDSIFSFEVPEIVIARTMVTIIAAVFAAGVLSRLLTPEPAVKPAERTASGGIPRTVEMAVFLGSVGALFLAFILVQMTYLFGGESNIAELGFTYAEYARNGFWELLAVGVITLVLLTLAQRVAHRAGEKRLAFIAPAALIVAEVFVIIVSAFKRLQLYVSAYGETALRFYVAAAILFLFVLFVMAGYRILRSKPERFFAFGALLALIAFVGVIDLMNPDAFIVRKNFELYSETGKIDVGYFSTLSADAVPELMKNIDKLGGEEKNQLQRILSDQRMRLEEYDSWRSWNSSRSEAAEMLRNLGSSQR